MLSRLTRIGTSLASFLTLLVVWELAVRFFGIKPIMLPAPSGVLTELASEFPWYAEHAMFTIGTTIAGFALSVVVGVLLGVVIASSRWSDSIIYPQIVAMNSVPKVAIAPLFVIWLGTGAAPKIAISFLIAVFAIVVDTMLGLHSLPPDIEEFARLLKGRAIDVFFKIRLPAALPAIFSGMKVAISLALVGTIVGEFVAAQRGLGFVILSAQGLFDTTRVFAAIILLAVIGLVLFWSVSAAERRLLHWQA